VTKAFGRRPGHSIEAQLVGGIEIVELDHIRVQEHSRRPEVDAGFFRLAVLAPSHSKSIASPGFEYTDIQYHLLAAAELNFGDCMAYAVSPSCAHRSCSGATSPTDVMAHPASIRA
jgi:hypothetical protein